jgi:hypothetical protein
MKKKDDIDRAELKQILSGKKKKIKLDSSDEFIRPDKSSDPQQMFRQENKEKNSGDEMTRLLQGIEDVVEQERNFPDKVEKERFAELKAYLKKQK